MIDLTPDEYIYELNKLSREFPELSAAAIIEMIHIIYGVEEDIDE